MTEAPQKRKRKAALPGRSQQECNSCLSGSTTISFQCFATPHSKASECKTPQTLPACPQQSTACIIAHARVNTEATSN